MERKREIWVDDVKVIACILVVLGHFFQSMTKANILPENDLYRWFNQTIYYFHVPLFFICSGYLYQRFSKVDGIKSWGNNVAKKALSLGIPYFTFSFATWLLKTLFSSSVNDEIGGLFQTLFLQPAAPYWYMYALFFVFLVTPTFASVCMATAGLLIALAGKALILSGGGTRVYAISTVLSNEIWFVFGMCLAVVEWKQIKLCASISLGVLFVALSILVFKMEIVNGFVSFILGMLACAAVIGIIESMDKNRSKPIFHFFAKYTMPIFLMHTLFAAPFRSVLLKIGVNNAVAHIAGGLVISFIGPIIAAEIMKKTKVLEFFLYPGKFVKMK